jgi:serine/threonine-protein kinase
MILPSGARLGPYELVSLLGAGGMGEVYAARDTRLDRRVAVKILPPALAADRTFRDRFEREARTASSLSHPNICMLFDVGEQQGIAYLVMEYVDGETLSAILARARPSLADALDWAIQCAEGLGAAHAAGVVHRDLKPGNIMITNGRAKLLDFGLARFFEPSTTNVTLAISEPGVVSGTVMYMSPEQARGEALDHRSDIFSFGVVLYEMTAGVRPFTGEQKWSVLQRITEVDPPPLSHLRADVPPALEALLRKLLAKSPADRPQSMTEVADALRAIRRGPMRAPFWTRARARLAAAAPSRAALAAAALLVIAIGVAGWSLWRTPAAPQQAAPREPVTAYEWAQEGFAALLRHDRVENIDRAIAAFERAVALEPNNAYALAGLAEALLQRDRFQPDPQWVRRAVEASQRAVQANPDMATAQAAYGAVLIRTKEDEKGIGALQRALDLDPKHVQAHLTLGARHLSRGELSDAEARFKDAVALAPRAWKPLDQLARVHYAAAKYKDAAAQWEAALALTPDNPQVLRSLGGTYHMLGRPADAASTLQRAIEIQPSATVYSNLGTIRFFQGRYSDAAAAFERAVELNATYYLYWANLGDAYRWSPGAEARARDAYSRALALIDESLKQSPANPDLMTQRALYLAKSGSAREAAAALENWARLPKVTAASYFRASVVREIGGDRAAAVETLQQAMAAGYARTEIENEPELARLRADVRYHQMLARIDAGARSTTNPKE